MQDIYFAYFNDLWHRHLRLTGWQKAEDHAFAVFLKSIYDLRDIFRAWEEEKAGYRSDQPRVPRGHPHGGQWTREGGGDASAGEAPLPYDPPIEPAYLVEEALAFLTVGEALVAVKSLRTLWQGIAPVAEGNILRAAKSIERYLGGPGKFIRNKHGDAIIIRGKKKIRFDLNNTGGDKPHFQIERQTSFKKWRDAGKQHRYYFKEE